MCVFYVFLEHHKLTQNSVFCPRDVFYHFSLLVIFTWLTANLYSVTHPQHAINEDQLVTHKLWWNSGSVICGFTMGIVHFYSPIYRVRFSSDPQSECLANVNVKASIQAVLTSALLGWLVMGGVCGKLLFELARSICSIVHVTSCRFVWTSFLLSPSSLFHVVVVCVEAFIFLKTVEVIIQLLVTGKNLRVTQQKNQPMAVLLGGLGDDESGFSQEAAVYELFELVLFEENKRRQLLFTETINDSIVVKEILLHLINVIQHLTQKCRDDLEAMRAFEKSLTLPSSSLSSSPLLSNHSAGLHSRHQDKVNVLIPHAKPKVDHKQDDSRSIIFQLAPRMIRSSIGRSLLVLWINGFRRVKHLPKYQLVECMVTSIGVITSVSLEEDSYGQIQLLLPTILRTLVEFNSVLCGLNAPIKSFPQCPPSEIVFSIQQTCRGSILSIVDSFTLPGLQSSAIRLDRDLLVDIEEMIP